jgi:hypothetical protein
MGIWAMVLSFPEAEAFRSPFPAAWFFPCADEREKANHKDTQNTKTRGTKEMHRRLLAIFWIALGVGLVILALSRSTTTTPVSHRVPGQGRMQPFTGAEPRSGSTRGQADTER